VQLLAFGETDADFGFVAFVEVEHERDDRQSFTADFAEELFELSLVQEQFAWGSAVGCEVSVGGVEMGDVDIHQKKFALDEAAVAIFQVGAFGAERFDFASLQDDSCLEFFQYLIVMIGFSIFCNDIDGHRDSLFDASIA